jgi:hypothetical protein
LFLLSVFELLAPIVWQLLSLSPIGLLFNFPYE